MKYPRTPHLPFSPGGTSDDRRIDSLQYFVGKALVVSCKMDGSNVCMESENCYARSHASPPKHPSFDAFKAFHAFVKSAISPGVQVFMECLYAKHSIHYEDLPGYFLLFGVRDLDKGIWASWEETKLWAEELGVPTVPVIDSFTCETVSKLESKLKDIADSLDFSRQEGFVVRLAAEFKDADFGKSICKFVRAGHVQTEEHWAHKEIIRNKLKE